jgi:hypothetical protein
MHRNVVVGAQQVPAEKLAEMRKNHEENVERARQYCQKQMDLRRAEVDAQRHAKKRQRVEARPNDPAECMPTDAKDADGHTTAATTVAPSVTGRRPPSRRSVETPLTLASTRLTSPKMQVGEPAAVPLLYPEDGAFGPDPRAPEALTARSDREEPCDSPAVRYAFAEQLLRDGLVAHVDDDGGDYKMDGMSADSWMRCDAWVAKVSQVQLSNDRNTAIVSDGGTGAWMVGRGAFNVVVRLAAGQLPPWVPPTAVLRFTRPWRDAQGYHRYRSMSVASRECAHAMFASGLNIGVRVYSVTGYVSPRDGRSLRYGIAMTMERATCDMRQQLARATTESAGAAVARSTVELLYRASKHGVAFFDIKPANVLVLAEGCHRLTDYDPAFFVVAKGRDWKALLLCNLALLSAHVYNAGFAAAGAGFLRGVAPLLRQMLRMRHSMDGEWLFCTRSVTLSVRPPNDQSDFELQRVFAQMCDAYFYGDGVEACAPSLQWKWDRSQQVELEQCWRTPSLRNAWPARWGKPARPLVQQLVEMALSRV